MHKRHPVMPTRPWMALLLMVALCTAGPVCPARNGGVAPGTTAIVKHASAAPPAQTLRQALMNGPDEGLPGFVRHGDLSKKEIALTFDDGPKPVYTEKLLVLLKKYNVKATFFLVGMRAQQYPEIVREIAADGHTIANHTFHHPALTNVSMQEITEEMLTCGNVLRDITGQTPRFFRPPGGNFDQRVYQAAVALGYTMVMWNVIPRDCDCTKPELIKSRILEHAGNGSIVLLHVGLPQTLQALPGVITTLRAQGYQFVTLDEMLKTPGDVAKDIEKKKTVSRTP